MPRTSSAFRCWCIGLLVAGAVGRCAEQPVAPALEAQSESIVMPAS